MKKAELRHLKAKDLKIDKYQRDFNETNPAVSKTFDPRKVGALIISKRNDGHYIIDGQHRCAGANASNPETLLPCVVYEGLTVEEEAQLFRDLAKEKKALGSLDDYNAALVALDPIALSIFEILKKAGLKVSRHECKHGIQAVSALKTAHTNGNLENTIKVVKAWRDATEDSYAFEGQNIRAVSCFLREYPEALITTLIDKLKAIAPERMLNKYKLRKQTGESTREAPVLEMLIAYNTKNTKKLQQKLAA